MPKQNFYALTVAASARLLASSETAGLPAPEASRRLAEVGFNQLQEQKGAGPLSIFIDQFRDFIIWILIGAALVSGFLREWIDACAIIAIVILNALLGFIQEYRAEKSLAALKKLASPQAKVIRDGHSQIIPAQDLVPGDLIEAEAGDNIPADSRLVYGTPNFSTQEASLTGESTPVAKTAQPLAEQDYPLADRANMVYLGTYVASGKARALVVETGMRTELGKIAGLIQTVAKETTPLQKKLEEFSRWLVYLCAGLVFLVFLLEIWRGGDLINVLLTSVSLAVAAIPEGLPAVVTIALALGVQRMVGRHVLIRKLPSVETLGSATVICSDKTGTLTKNEMTVQAVYAGGILCQLSGVGYEPVGNFSIAGKTIQPADFPELLKCLQCGVLCNGAQLQKDRIIGDPTEGAILTAAAKAGLWKDELETAQPLIAELPFDSQRKKMTIIREAQGKVVVYVKGAPDILLTDCVGLDEAKRREITRMNDELSGQALRVLALASKVLERRPDNYDPASVERELTFLGLVAMIDPPRPEVKIAVGQCKSAGIKTVMITGDHENTARAIARELGIEQVFARVSPEDKLRIVRELKRQGEVVAMTGDGVNDAPAVKEADIGVAMGITGTDVTKEVSDMVVTDDNFASIVAAVEEGRGIYDNIKKFIHYLLSCNVGEILVMFSASLIGLPIPLLPIQILWVNLVTDGLPALALGVDPVGPDIMQRKPRPPHEKVISLANALGMLGQGALIAGGTLLAFAFVLYGRGEGIEHARTAAFVVLACGQLFHAFNCRSERASIFKIGLFSNTALVAAVLGSFILQVLVVHTPFTNLIFQTTPLDLVDWLFVLAVSSLPLWGMELVKRANKNGRGGI